MPKKEKCFVDGKVPAIIRVRHLNRPVCVKHAKQAVKAGYKLKRLGG